MTPVDITVTGEDFVSINQEADIPVGTELQLQTKSNHPVIVQRKDSKPSSEDTNGRVMKGIRNKSSIYQVREGSEEVWLRLDTDNLLSAGKVSAGLVFGEEEPAVNYVARTDGLTQQWNFSAPISTDEGDYFTFQFSASDNAGSFGEFKRILGSDSNYGMRLGVRLGDNAGVFEELEVIATMDGNEISSGDIIPDDGVLRLASVTPLSPSVFQAVGGLATVSNRSFAGVIKMFRHYDSRGVLLHEIPLTNKDQGATQLPTVGSVSATMPNYTPDIWEVDKDANS